MCPRCEADPKPEGFGDRRQCAFDAEGHFTPENWNCATIDAILGDEPTVVRGDDEQCEVTPTYCDDGEHEYGGFLITTRHKRRGCTSSAIYVGDFHPPQPLTLALAERVIASRASHEVWRAKYGMPR